MPDPVASASAWPEPICKFEDEPALALDPPPTGSPANLRTEPAPASVTSALVQKFARSDQPMLVAPSPTPASSPAAPPVLTVRPDQVDLQTGMPRVVAHATWGDVQLTAGVDILNANAHLGSLNSDGSRGENIGAGASLLGGELSIDYKGWSLTVGVAASLGGSISSGDSRDLDADGVRERCFAMSLGPFTLGECDEL